MTTRQRLLIFFLSTPIALLLIQFLLIRHYVTRDFQSYLLDQSLMSAQVVEFRASKILESVENKLDLINDTSDSSLTTSGLLNSAMSELGFKYRPDLKLDQEFSKSVFLTKKQQKYTPYINTNTLYIAVHSSSNPALAAVFETQNLTDGMVALQPFSFLLFAKNGPLFENDKQYFKSKDFYRLLEKQASPSAFRSNIEKKNWTFGLQKISGKNLFLLSKISKQDSNYFSNLISIRIGILTIALLCIALAIGFFLVSQFVTPLQHIVNAMDIVGKGNYDFTIEYYSNDEFGRLVRRFNEMLASIRSYLWKQKELIRMKSELETANIVQRLINTSLDHNYNDFSVVGLMITASECGGDYWTHFENDGRIYVVIGDATGHGASAALVTSAVGAAINSLKLEKINSISELFEKLNKIIFSTFKGEIYMTMSVISFDPRSNKISVGVAGHSSVAHIQNTTATTSWKEIQNIGDVSSPIGRSLDSQFYYLDIEKIPGLKMMMYTDGFFEVNESEGKVMTERTLFKDYIESLNKASNHHNVGKYLKEKMTTRLAGTNPKDDITFISIKFDE